MSGGKGYVLWAIAVVDLEAVVPFDGRLAETLRAFAYP